MNDDSDLTAKVVRASLWAVAGRWGVRLIGFVSVVVFARLLDPADFGLMAMAMSFMAFIDLFTAWGFTQAIVRHPAPTTDHYDTAWTIQVLVGLLCAALAAAAAPTVADFFREPRVTEVIWVLSASFVVSGFTNIGLADLQRDFRFGEEFRFLLTSRLVAFALTMIAAFVLRSYWALVFGALAMATAKLVFGFLFVPRRPRFTLARKTELLSFSSWLVVRNFAAFAIQRFDIVVLSRIYAVDLVGPYDVAKNLSTMIIAESLLPLSRALLPGFSKIADDPRRLVKAEAKTTGIYASIALPMGVGLALVADEVIHLVLGAKWAGAAPYFILLSIGHAVSFLNAGLMPVLLAQGRSGRLALTTGLQAAVFVIVVLVMAQRQDMVLVAASSLISLVAVIPLQMRLGLGSWRRAWGALQPCLRPVLATAVMAAGVLTLDVDAFSNVGALTAKVVVGVVVYTFCLFVLWVAAGRPLGLEVMALGFFERQMRSIRTAHDDDQASSNGRAQPREGLD